ncbi:hypothetical protein V1478_017887, partial [Vespula squamosa]
NDSDKKKKKGIRTNRARDREKELGEEYQRVIRRAGSSGARLVMPEKRSFEPQSSRTCLDAPWWLEIRARRCYFFCATSRGDTRGTRQSGLLLIKQTECIPPTHASEDDTDGWQLMSGIHQRHLQRLET